MKERTSRTIIRHIKKEPLTIKQIARLMKTDEAKISAYMRYLIAKGEPIDSHYSQSKAAEVFYMNINLTGKDKREWVKSYLKENLPKHELEFKRNEVLLNEDKGRIKTAFFRSHLHRAS